MKNPNIITVLSILLLSTMVVSCSAIAGIFKAGMGFGAFAVIAVIFIIIVMVVRLGKSKDA